MSRFLCNHFTDICLQEEFLTLRQADVSKILVSYDLGQARLVNITLANSFSNKNWRFGVEYASYCFLIHYHSNLIFLFLSYEDIWKAIVAWCEQDNSRKIFFKDLIKNINFGFLDPEFCTNNIINHSWIFLSKNPKIGK